MSDFFKELEEEIREERVVILWRKYGKYIIMLAITIVLATGGYSLWKYLKHQRQIKGHVSFAQAVTFMNQGNKDEALKAFQAISKEGGGYGKLAQLYEAALVQNPDVLYTQIASKYISDPALGNLPKILKAAHEINNTEALAPLEPLTAPKNAWAPLALELLAFAELKRGDEVKAAELYIRLLKEPSLTSGEQIRAGMILSQINVPQFLLDKELNKEGQE